jgi:hypothetical protein
MKKIFLIALGIMLLTGTVSAYGLYVSCPASIQVGLPLKCSIDSDFPAGTALNLVLYQSQYTATQIKSEPVVIQDDHATQYRLFDTTGLPGGQYKVEAQFVGAKEWSLRSDSVTSLLVTLQDRSGDITINSPMSQPMADALRIEGAITKEGNDGVEIEVRGPDGRIFGPQYIGTKSNIQNGAGVFTQKVTVTSPGDYDVSFTDSKGYIGTIRFLVTAPATQEPTARATTTARVTTRPPATIPTPYPTTTKSPLSPLPVAGALIIAGLFITLIGKKSS